MICGSNLLWKSLRDSMTCRLYWPKIFSFLLGISKAKRFAGRDQTKFSSQDKTSKLPRLSSLAVAAKQFKEKEIS